MDTFQLVARSLAKRLELEYTEIGPETDLLSLGIDSLDAAELLMDLEDKLGIEIEPTKKLATVKDLVAAIDEAADAAA